MKFALSRSVRIAVGLVSLTAGLLALAYLYLSRHKLEVHITSKIVGAIFVLVVIIVFQRHLSRAKRISL
jgi:hypothetical protein